MIELKMLEELLEKQTKLNDFIWSNREEGLPYVDKLTVDDKRLNTRWFYEESSNKGTHELIHFWAAQFHRCMQSELFELWEEETKGENTDFQNARVEMIDIIHFHLCMAQVLGMEASDILNTTSSFKPPCDRAFDLMIEAQEFLECFNWKHWSNDFDMKVQDWEKAKEQVRRLWHQIVGYSETHLDLDLDSISNLYALKWEVNWQRQLNKYSKATKTDDNKALTV